MLPPTATCIFPYPSIGYIAATAANTPSISPTEPQPCTSVPTISLTLKMNLCEVRQARIQRTIVKITVM